jgi:putative membrane protein
MTTPSDKTRDHLANERTFLAWVRTALGLIGLGFVLARMGLFLEQVGAASLPELRGRFHGAHEFIASGVLFLLLGVASCAWAGKRYQDSRIAIDGGRFQPAQGSIRALTAIVIIGGLLIIGLVLWRLVG